MKSHLLLIRLLGLLLLISSASVVEAKGCVGSLWAKVQHADGTVTPLAGQGSGYGFNASVSLSPGDTVIVYQTTAGSCYSTYGLRATGASLGDTATYSSPVVYGNSTVSSGLKITQPGSYYVWQLGVDYGGSAFLFVDAIQAPVAVVLLFTKQNTALGVVDAGDTCTGPCVTVYLEDGQSVRMQAISGGMVQVGGNAIVRHATEGEPLDFGSPYTTVPLSGFEGYQFSEDGMYLLSVEGPFITSSAFAYVRVSHQTPPRVDMSLTIERADGSPEEVAYVQSNNYTSNIAVDLGPGDSLRIDHFSITEQCDPVRLKIYKSPNWSPAYSSQTPLAVDTLSTSAGIRMATPGSYRLQHATDCGFPSASTLVTINAPVPQLDLVVSVRHNNGLEGEIFRSHLHTDLQPHLNTYLYPGDSIRVHYEETGWCGPYKSIAIYWDNAPEVPIDPGYLLTNGQGNEQDITFRFSAMFRILLYNGSPDPLQDVYLDIGNMIITGIDMQVDQEHADGTSFNVTYAEAGGPTAFANTELAADDSIRVLGIMQGSPCADLVLKAYRAEADTATTLYPVFLDTPLDPSGLAFHETGSLLLTLEDTCGAVTASAHLTVSTALSTGISTQSESGFNARYANDLLLVDARTGGLLQIRNIAGQLVGEVNLTAGPTHSSIPFSGKTGGVYIATLLGPSHVDVRRFAVY